jgi:hypothetical protein
LHGAISIRYIRFFRAVNHDVILNRIAKNPLKKPPKRLIGINHIGLLQVFCDDFGEIGVTFPRNERRRSNSSLAHLRCFVQIDESAVLRFGDSFLHRTIISSGLRS